MIQTKNLENSSGQIHFGHLGVVLVAAVLLLGVSWMEKPQLFSFKNADAEAVANDPNIPHYYAYVTPPDDVVASVAGTSTVDQGPMLINEDGTISPAIDPGQVLGASTQNPPLSLDDISVNQIPDSDAAVKAYLAAAQNIESGFIDNADFEAALSSSDQSQINSQAQKLTDIKNNLQKLPVPQSLVKLQKLKILQYMAGVVLLNNLTQANNNPELVGQYLNQFLQAQQDMDTEEQTVDQKYNIPNYLTPDTQSVSDLLTAGQSTSAGGNTSSAGDQSNASSNDQ